MVTTYSKGEMIGLAVASLILPAFFVGLRIWAKIILGAKRLGWDDHLVFIGLVFSIACCVTQLIATNNGRLGQHQKDDATGFPILNDPGFLVYEKCKFALQMLSAIGLGSIKLSILVLYMNIFAVRPFRIAAQIMIGIVVAWTIAFFFAYLFTCYPITPLVEAFYHNKCVDTIPFWYTGQATDVALDLVILAMPIPMVLKLKMPRKQRLAIMGMFLTGAAVCAVSITRVVVFYQVGNSLQIHFNDETYYTSPVFFWTVIEMALSVVSACLPTLRPIFLGYRSPNPTQIHSSTGYKSFDNTNRAHRKARSGYDDSVLEEEESGDISSISHLHTIRTNNAIEGGGIPLENLKTDKGGGILVKNSYTVTSM